MKIAIAGYGVEGQQNYAYWSMKGEHDITIVDENPELRIAPPEGAATLLGEGAFNKLDDFDMVVRTAGLAPYKITTNGKIWSATNEFFEHCPAPIIGVTGSKGKGTTASLTAGMLEASGKKVWLVGNIGIAALSVLSQIKADDIVVYELSSFQLWDMQFAPNVAVVLYIEPEHLNIHRSMEEYVEAKAQITAHQTLDNTLIYNEANQYAQQIADGSKAQKVAYPSDRSAHIKDGAFYYDEQYICDLDQLTLRGEHNQQNALAAIDAAWLYTQDTKAITKGLHEFHGLPHRLAYVATVDQVTYYDDSIATTPSSAVAALRSFAAVSKVIILGGSSKKSDYAELAEELTRHEVTVLLVGDVADELEAALQAAGISTYERLDNASMRDVVKRAAEVATPGGVVLLSPAAASFGAYRDYADRGNQFIDAVHTLQKGADATTR